MTSAAGQLYAMALQAALVLALPVVALVAIVGIVSAIAQTVIGIQDQNISFGPKIAAVALLVALAGIPGLALLAELLRAAISAMPHLAG